MHASLEDLLIARDGAADRATRDHLGNCPECRAELERLRKIGSQLRSLPEAVPPEDRWQTVQRRLRERRLGRNRLPLFSGVAVAASLVLAMTFLVRVEGPPAPKAPDPLVERSQQLERELRAMERGGVMNGAEAQFVARLEDRIALVDLQLASEDLGPEEAERLWRYRVDLLMDLKAIRSDEVYVADSSNYLL